MKENIHTDLEKTENQSLNSKKLPESFEHEINRYVFGSVDAKRSIMAVYLFGSVLNHEKFKNSRGTNLQVKKIVPGIEFI